MPEKKRFLKSVIVSFISLVDRGANRKKIIFKSENASNETYQKMVMLTKLDEDQHMVYGIVYSPGEPDTEGDFTNAEVIKQMAYNFMKTRSTNNVDFQHDCSPDEGFIAESWILEKNDPRFPGEPEGSWAVGIKVTNDATWLKIKQGEITGLSMAGIAEVEPFFDDRENEVKKNIEDISVTRHRSVNLERVQKIFSALSKKVKELFANDSITDKKSALLKNIELFKTDVSSSEFQKENQSIIYKNKDTEMTREEINQIVGSEITDAIRPYGESISEVKTILAEIDKRLKSIEEDSPGSAQNAASGDVRKRADSYLGPGWLS